MRDRGLVEIQRARILAAAVAAIDELGYGEATVARITGRARISRRTFYELFDNREQCVAAVIEDAALQVRAELVDAGVPKLGWRIGMRMGLWSILCFLERNRALARVCLVHCQQGAGAVVERREAIVAELVAAVDEGRLESARAGQCSPVTAEGVVGAVFAILCARLARDESAPLADLLGELAGTIVLPYLGAAAARREQTRPLPARPRAQRAAPYAPSDAAPPDPLAGLPMRLTYRTVLVLARIGQHPGASNREIARHAEIEDQGQVSKLLARLQRLGLIVNEGVGQLRGECNSWWLTSRGALIARTISAGADTTRAVVSTHGN